MACSCCGQTKANVYFGCNPISPYQQFPESLQPPKKTKWEFQSQKSIMSDPRPYPAACTETQISFGYHGQPSVISQCHNYPVHHYATIEGEDVPNTAFQQKTFQPRTTTSQPSVTRNRIVDASQRNRVPEPYQEKEKQHTYSSIKSEIGSQFGRQTSAKTETFSQLSQRNADNQLRLKKPPVLDKSLRIITIQIKRLRGISVQLKRCLTVDILFEIMGKCISRVEHFTHLQGFQFVLQELHSKISGATVNCAFYDFDEISPTVQCGMTYRCVGKYHSNHRVFQCFMIEECDSESIRLMELFESHSDREVAKLIEASNRNAVTNSKAVKIPYTGLEPPRYARKVTGNDWGQHNRYF